MSSLSQRVATRRFSFIRPNMRFISLRFLYFFLSYLHFFIRFRRHARFHVETLRKRTRLIFLADLVHRQCSTFGRSRSSSSRPTGASWQLPADSVKRWFADAA